MQLRPYQSEAIAATWQQLKTPGGGNPLIVLPTGSGKSVVIASLAMDAVKKYAGRVVVLQHRKELIEQNADKIKRLCDVPVGLYSAGLNRKQINEDIIVGGVQSIYKRAGDLGRRHMVICDECHLLPEEGEGMFRTFIEQLGELNPNLKVCGLTATPYRSDSGKLWGNDSLFPRVTYDAGIQPLIAGGFLCPVTSNPGEVDYDTSGLHIRAGEFKSNELADLFDSDSEKTKRAVSEIVARSSGRHSVLIFCSSVEHSYHVATEIQRQTGEECGCIVGETMAIERASILERFKNRQLRWLTNCAVLTTGFDAPCIDMIAILRATASPGLFAQICGRGLRTDTSKANCKILDFGQNIRRFGPIDAIEFNERNTKRSGEQDAPMKMCPGCREEVHAGVRVCECGFQFPKPELKHDETPDGESKILSEPEEFEVVQQTCNVHRKKNDPDGTPTLRVNYYVRPINEEDQGNVTEETISEWICFEHPPGFARSKAMEWWRARSLAPFPTSCEEAESLFDRGVVAQSRSIVARREGKWWRIIEHVLDEIPDPSGIEVEADNSDDWGDEEMPF